MFALPISKSRFKKALFFNQNSPKMSYFCKKMQNFRALGAPPPDPRASGGWGICPQTPSLRQRGAFPQAPKTALPIANFWLRACIRPHS